MKFKEYINEISVIDEIPNNNLLTEAGLSRLLNQIKDKDFGVITAYRDIFDKNQNTKRNRILRTDFNKRKMGVYQLIGHWQECQDNTIDYENCPKNQLVNVIERSYLVVKPENVSQEEFLNIFKELTKKYDQDSSIICFDGKINLVFKNGGMQTIGSEITLNKISQAYSQYIKKQNIPFVFECEVPSSISGRMVFKHENVLYPVMTEKIKIKTWDHLFLNEISFNQLSNFLKTASDSEKKKYRELIKKGDGKELKKLVESI